MSYSKEEIEFLFSSICKKMGEEGRSLRSVLSEEGMPDRSTFYEWIRNDDLKSDHYARVKEDRADYIFEDILNIADETHNDRRVKSDGAEVVDHEAIQRSKLRVDARKWMLSKMLPKKYGDKIDVTSDGDKIGGDKSINISLDGKDINLGS